MQVEERCGGMRRDGEENFVHGVWSMEKRRGTMKYGIWYQSASRGDAVEHAA